MTPRSRRHPVVEPLAQAISDIARSVSSPVPSEQPESEDDYQFPDDEPVFPADPERDAIEEHYAFGDLNEASEADDE